MIIAAGQPVYTFDVVERDTQGGRFHYVAVDVNAEYISARVQVGDARWVASEQFAEMDINPRT